VTTESCTVEWTSLQHMHWQWQHYNMHTTQCLHCSFSTYDTVWLQFTEWDMINAQSVHSPGYNLAYIRDVSPLGQL